MIINLMVMVFFIIGFFISFRYRFIQFRAFKETKRILVDEKNKESYSTFMVSLASHIGTGNIIGIATALIYAGPGSIFWMCIFTVFSSIFSLIENTLAQIYKVKINGENRGGASFYIRYGFGNKVLAFIFSIVFLLTGTIFFQPLQVNTISESLHLVFGIDRLIILLGLFLFSYFIIFKGTKRIVRFCEHIVPIMGIGYISIAILVILINIRLFPSIIIQILNDAFSIKSIFGGTAASCVLIGFKRALFSNEAGLGTTPSISAMANPKYPLSQGFVQVIGTMIDTIFMCSLTGFMILIYQVEFTSFKGVDLIISIFQSILGSFGIYLALFFMLTFAIATVVSQFYVGESNLLYVFSKNKYRKYFLLLYKIFFLLGITIGVNFSTKSIFGFVDQGMILLGVCNLYALFRLRKDFNNQLAIFYNKEVY